MLAIGYLKKNDDGRYELINSDGKYITYFTSGEPIEIWNGTIWMRGRIEYNHDIQDYYFYNPNGRHISLHDGLKARMVIR